MVETQWVFTNSERARDFQKKLANNMLLRTHQASHAVQFKIAKIAHLPAIGQIQSKTVSHNKIIQDGLFHNMDMFQELIK